MKRSIFAAAFLTLSAAVILAILSFAENMDTARLSQGLELSPRGSTPEDALIYLEPEYPHYAADTESVSFFFINNSDAYESYGYTDTVLEVRLNNAWYIVPYKPDIGFNLPLLWLPAGGEKAVTLRLDSFDYDFHEGVYRLAKGYGDDKWAFGEFTLGKASAGSDLCAIEDQSTSPRKAAKDGAVVLTPGHEKNTDEIPAFFRKLRAEMRCTLRVVENDAVTDYIYNGHDFEVVFRRGENLSSSRYSYLAARSGELCFTNFADPDNRPYEYSNSWDFYNLSQLQNALSPEQQANINEIVQELTRFRIESSKVVQAVISADGKYNVGIMIQPDFDNTGNVYVSTANIGSAVDFFNIDGSLLEAVYVRWLEGSVFRLIFRTEHGDKYYDFDGDPDKRPPGPWTVTLDAASLPDFSPDYQ